MIRSRRPVMPLLRRWLPQWLLSAATEGLMDLAVDLATALAMLIEQVAAGQGRSAVDVADELFHD